MHTVSTALCVLHSVRRWLQTEWLSLEGEVLVAKTVRKAGELQGVLECVMSPCWNVSVHRGFQAEVSLLAILGICELFHVNIV